MSSEPRATTRTVRMAMVRAIIEGCADENRKSDDGSSAKRPLEEMTSDLTTAPLAASTHVRSSPFCLASAAHFTETATRCQRPTFTLAFVTSPNEPRIPTPPEDEMTASPSVCLSLPPPPLPPFCAAPAWIKAVWNKAKPSRGTASTTLISNVIVYSFTHSFHIDFHSEFSLNQLNLPKRFFRRCFFFSRSSFLASPPSIKSLRSSLSRLPGGISSAVLPSFRVSKTASSGAFQTFSAAGSAAPAAPSPSPPHPNPPPHPKPPEPP
mmetsp:Transcript_80197/g.214808  ORF Transcript_80197/g.214808 Transcript_80197/m.214808 type:complete len:266 (-) Transcript_80197:610-1407(-)